MSEILSSVYQMMERTGVKEGILFLDEINCVSETLVPMMLQSYKMQARLHPEHTDQIRRWPTKVLYVGQMALLVIAVWRYMFTVDSGYELLKQFRFVWQSEGPSSLELLADMLATYGVVK